MDAGAAIVNASQVISVYGLCAGDLDAISVSSTGFAVMQWANEFADDT